MSLYRGGDLRGLTWVVVVVVIRALKVIIGTGVLQLIC